LERDDLRRQTRELAGKLETERKGFQQRRDALEADLARVKLEAEATRVKLGASEEQVHALSTELGRVKMEMIALGVESESARVASQAMVAKLRDDLLTMRHERDAQVRERDALGVQTQELAEKLETEREGFRQCSDAL
jgi:septal ring factor EnvC (AmiA/AmiB activator)